MTGKLVSFRREIIAFALVLFTAACASAPAPAPREAMVTAADPRAVEAGLEMLREGGSATDATIAAMMVLGLVEPQSAGVGGGGFLLAYDGASERIEAFDGRERAPGGATPDMFLNADGTPMSFRDAAHSGRSIGTPSLVAMLKLAHDRHGRLPWARLFEPAIRLADEGFIVSPRMAALIRMFGGDMREDPAARAYFFTPEGEPLPAGFRRTNAAYAATLRRIAAEGPRVLQQGPIAEEIVATAQRSPRAGTLTLADLQAYAPRRLDPLCGSFRVYRVCGMGPPSSGGFAVLSILGLYERARPTPGGPANADDWSAYMWASRLGYADRDYYIADDTYVPAPTAPFLAAPYLDNRATQIDIARAPTRIERGDAGVMIDGQPLAERWGRDTTDEQAGTTHLSVVDAQGNAVALTATVEAAFGAQRMAGGFLLNNQLTDFARVPTINGRPVANAVAGGKRPRSSMSPTIVTDRDGELVAVIGSPGGSGIIGYVSRTLIGVLAWDQTMQDAISTGNVIASSNTVRIETSRLPPGTQEQLAARGWTLRAIQSEDSGLHGIRVTPNGLDGGADPRREGTVGRLPAPTPATTP